MEVYGVQWSRLSPMPCLAWVVEGGSRGSFRKNGSIILCLRVGGNQLVDIHFQDEELCKGKQGSGEWDSEL